VFLQHDATIFGIKLQKGRDSLSRAL